MSWKVFIQYKKTMVYKYNYAADPLGLFMRYFDDNIRCSFLLYVIPIFNRSTFISNEMLAEEPEVLPQLVPFILYPLRR